MFARFHSLTGVRREYASLTVRWRRLAHVTHRQTEVLLVHCLEAERCWRDAGAWLEDGVSVRFPDLDDGADQGMKVVSQVEMAGS
jgi:hypothetical protein